jgi:hypothetical protein
MRNVLYVALLGTVAWLLLSPGVADAQVRCLEGKTASGECVNVGLAATLRQIGIIFSQPKLSYTAYPVLPSDDASVRYPNQLNPDPLKPSLTTGPAFSP